MRIFIGYDPREREGYEVCKKSIERRTSVPVDIIKLDQAALVANGWFTRKWYWQEKQRIDIIDGKPFSTEFSFTRFMVPALSLHQGWAMFCDCDFLFTADIAGLFRHIDNRYAVMCVKHQHEPAPGMKMDGVTQTRYHRKNWSSLVLWNCGHPANRAGLSTHLVNHATGAWLHAFDWLEDGLIGGLPITWNWLAGYNATTEEIPCGIHFTNGLPCMAGHQNDPYAELWFAERESRRYATGPLPTERVRAFADVNPRIGVNVNG